MVEGVAGIVCGSFPNGTLGGANTGFYGVEPFWVLAFGASHSASASSRDGVAVVDNMGGVKATSGGQCASFAVV